jgi:hypothetical protein
LQIWVCTCLFLTACVWSSVFLVCSSEPCTCLGSSLTASMVATVLPLVRHVEFCRRVIARGLGYSCFTAHQARGRCFDLVF